MNKLHSKSIRMGTAFRVKSILILIIMAIALPHVSCQVSQGATNYRKEIAKYQSQKGASSRRRDRYQMDSEDMTKAPETVDEYYELINSFLDGFNSEQFIPNAVDCSSRSQIFLNDNNAMRIQLENDETLTAIEQLRLVTGIISNQFAESYLYCHMSVYDGYIFYLVQDELYKGDPLEWLQAFLQNLVGNSVTITNLSNKIVIAEDNGDNRLKHFIIGSIVYHMMDFEPIEEASLYFQDGASWTRIYKLLELMVTEQIRINTGQIDLDYQDINAAKDQRKIDQYLVKRAVSDAKKNHPNVQNFMDKIDTSNFDVPDDELTVWEQTEKYSTYAFFFFWSAQENSVGKMSGNFTVCLNQTETMYDRILEIRDHYVLEEYGEAGTATYLVLKTIDPIVFACYFATFEYYYSFDTYANTIKDINKLLYNFAHNLGDIYDLTEEGVKRMIDYETEYVTKVFWVRMGAVVGAVSHNFLMDPVNYYPWSESLDARDRT